MSSTDTPLTAARAQLAVDPQAAEQQAEAILRDAPGDIEALLILAAAHRKQGNLFESLAILKPLVRINPDHAIAHLEWAITQIDMGLVQPAILSLRRAVALEPTNPTAWRLLGGLLAQSGEPALADAAFLHQIRHAMNDPILNQAARAFDADDFAQGEMLLRGCLTDAPNDAAALRMLGDVRLQRGDNIEAESLFARCLALAPSVVPARRHYAAALLNQGRADEALPHIKHLLAANPSDAATISLLASFQAMTGDHRAAIDTYRAIVRDHPDEPQMWLNLGFSLRAVGDRKLAVDAYRKAIEVAPDLGQAYWSLANLKAEPFTPAEISAMQAHAASNAVSDLNRLQMHYALGSAFETACDYAASFAHYAAGAELKRASVDYNADRTTAQFSQLRDQLTGPALTSGDRPGDIAPVPIFIVGLPRAGSTLVEQILASHSQVEGTSELHDIPDIARSLGWIRNGAATVYPARLAGLSADDRAALGQLYLRRTRVHRKLGRTFFTDKMPENFVHTGLIHRILPNARIIDIRRAPMAAGLAVFKQYFPRGQEFTFDLREIGLYYRDYIALMAHYDTALPGRVHRVLYEDLVTNTEAEIRRLLAYCGLEYEPACLRFHETRRDVLTASSEQVRQPIFREALDQWRNYEPWLGELKAALMS